MGAKSMADITCTMPGWQRQRHIVKKEFQSRSFTLRSFFLYFDIKVILYIFHKLSFETHTQTLTQVHTRTAPFHLCGF